MQLKHPSRSGKGKRDTRSSLVLFLLEKVISFPFRVGRGGFIEDEDGVGSNEDKRT
jgi:hypothetical protein